MNDVDNIKDNNEEKISVMSATFKDFEDAMEKARLEQKELLLREIETAKFYQVYIPGEFKDDKDIIKALLKKMPNTYRSFSDVAKSNKEVVLEVVATNGMTLGDVSDELRDDKDVVLAAIRETAGSLMYASERLRDDPEVVIEAVKNWPYIIQHASYRLKRICQDRDPYVTLLSFIREKKATKLRDELELKEQTAVKKPINKI